MRDARELKAAGFDAFTARSDDRLEVASGPFCNEFSGLEVLGDTVTVGPPGRHDTEEEGDPTGEGNKRASFDETNQRQRMRNLYALFFLSFMRMSSFVVSVSSKNKHKKYDLVNRKRYFFFMFQNVL